MTNLENVEEAYQTYLVAKEQAKAEAQKHLEMLMEEPTVELSRKMHAAHQAGLSKDRIRRAVKAYGNGWIFDPLWQAYTPETETDLRRKTDRAATVAREGKNWIEKSEGTIEIVSTGITLENVRWEQDEFNRYATWDGHDVDDTSVENRDSFVAANDYLTTIEED